MAKKRQTFLKEKWFTDRIEKQIWNDTLRTSVYITNEDHALSLYVTQYEMNYYYDDLVIDAIIKKN